MPGVTRNNESMRRAPRRRDSHPHADKVKKFIANVFPLQRCDNLQMPPTRSRHTMITRFHAASRPTVNILST